MLVIVVSLDQDSLLHWVESGAQKWKTGLHGDSYCTLSVQLPFFLGVLPGKEGR